MTRAQRKLLVRIGALGVLLTLTVVLADGLGWLESFERDLYDARARRFQFFSPPPSRDVVHVDIDDPSVDEIGRWPWHRSVMASMIDEIHLAGARVIYLDIILSEPQDAQLVQRPDGSLHRIDHDELLADAMRKASNALVPMSIGFTRQDESRPLFDAMVKILEDAPELELDEIRAALKSNGFDQPDLDAHIRSEKVDAAKHAMFNRLERELGRAGPSEKLMTADAWCQQILPRATKSGARTDTVLLLHKTLPAVRATRSLNRFAQADRPEFRGVLHGQPISATIPILCDAAKYTGYVDFVPESDGTVRAVPLFARSRGKIFPHITLAIACAQLGVDLQHVRYDGERVVIPAQPPIEIPVRHVNSESYGQVPLLVNIPWFGGANPALMYDAPQFAEPRQRIPARNIWDILQLQRDIEQNNDNADAALLTALGTFASQPEMKAYLALTSKERDAVRFQRVQEFLDDDFIKSSYDDFAALPADEQQKLTGKDRQMLDTYRALLAVRNRAKILVDQLPRKKAALREAVNGRAVLIGFTMTGGSDRYPTSLHPSCPGVSIIGTTVSGILARDMWRTVPWRYAALVTVLMGIATSFFVARLSPVPALLLSALLLAACGAINAVLLFDRNNVILPAAGTVTCIALCWSGLTLARYIIESRERRRITQQFSNYVDPALVDYFIENPEQMQVDGKVREMTVVFTDLAGFTTISEKLREATVPILNEYMSLMVPIIREHSGYWDKFLGDGIMFFYNGLAPITDHAVRAIDTAMEMQIVTDRFNERLKERQLPKVAMRAGISTGEMVVGDAGSKDTKHRANNFTVLGDAVNLGARLEGANKPIGTRILINGRTAELSENKFLLRPVGNVRVVGKLEGVQLFEPLCRIEQATDEQKQIVELSSAIVESFANAEFEKCACAARKMEEQLGTTKFSQFYLRIAREHLENPPKDFEGQIVLSEK